jgi:hypothetical protein
MGNSANDTAPIWFPEDAEASASRLDFLGLELFRSVPRLKPHLLDLHVLRALQDIATGLNRRNHRRADGQAIDCMSVFIDLMDPCAFSVETGEKSAAFMSVGMVRNLAAIAARLGECLKFIRHTGPRTKLAGDSRLGEIMLSRGTCSDPVLDEALAAMADPLALGGVPIGGFAIFYDLIRMVWVHEWAHVMLGHTGFARNVMGLTQLREHSAGRVEAAKETFEGHPLAQILQGFELHADEYAVKYCVGQILEGWDPVGEMMGPEVDLIDRMIAFNLACAVFAIVWSSSESPTYSVQTATHPPAALRYMNFRDYQREMCIKFDKGFAFVDFASYNLLEIAGELTPEFASVQVITPLVHRTPTMERLEQLSDFLMDLNRSLSANWRPFIYRPVQNER